VAFRAAIRAFLEKRSKGLPTALSPLVKDDADDGFKNVVAKKRKKKKIKKPG
jgi:hypothetical protein